MAISCVINLFFKGHMEYAIISFSVSDLIQSWLFHVFNLTGKGLMAGYRNVCTGNKFQSFWSSGDRTHLPNNGLHSFFLEIS